MRCQILTKPPNSIELHEICRMKFLITGGAGFIGSAVIRFLIEETAHKVLNLDKLTYAGNLGSLANVLKNPRYQFVHGDVCDRRLVTRVFADFKPDVVMHLAAESHVDRSIDGPAKFIETNILGTAVMLECAREYWQNLPSFENSIDRRATASSSMRNNTCESLMLTSGASKESFRFHHISTDEVYGSLAGTGLFTEETAYDPSSPYAASKASSDHLVRGWWRTYGLPVLITNCSNNYGPYQFPEKLIPLMILNALEGKPLPVYGDGQQIRDWLHVEDHARALYQVVIEGQIGETYNIGGSNEKTNLEVVHAICEILDELPHPLGSLQSFDLSDNDGNYQGSLNNFHNLPMTVTRKPMKRPNTNDAMLRRTYKNLITNVADRPGHDQRYAIDASKIQKDLGWAPKETFETGIRKTVMWYLDNLEWCKQVQDGSYQRQRLGVIKQKPGAPI